MPIDDRRREYILSAAQKQAQLANDAAQSMIELWQSRIDLALASGDEDTLRETVRSWTPFPISSRRAGLDDDNEVDDRTGSERQVAHTSTTVETVPIQFDRA